MGDSCVLMLTCFSSSKSNDRDQLELALTTLPDFDDEERAKERAKDLEKLREKEEELQLERERHAVKEIELRKVSVCDCIHSIHERKVNPASDVHVHV